MSSLMPIQPTFPLFSFRTNHLLLQSFAFARFLNRKPLTEKHSVCNIFSNTQYVIDPAKTFKYKIALLMGISFHLFYYLSVYITNKIKYNCSRSIPAIISPAGPKTCIFDACFISPWFEFFCGLVSWKWKKPISQLLMK